MSQFALLIGFAYPGTKYKFDQQRIRNDLLFVYSKIKYMKTLIITDISLSIAHRIIETVEEFLSLVYQFIEQIKPEDTLVVYFSGHGIASKKNTRLLITGSEKLSYDQLLGIIEDLPPKTNVILILDCCDAEGILQPEDVQEQRIVLLAACKRKQIAGFHKQKQVSLFTYYVFNLWGNLDLSILMGPVQAEINRLRRQYGKPIQEITYDSNRTRYLDHFPNKLI